MPEEDRLDVAAEAVYKELEKVGGDPLRLNPVLRPVALLYTFQAMVDNGGFRYPFENDFPFTPPYSAFSDAYRQIGALDAAARLDKAVTLFPFADPHTKSSERNEYMDSLDEEDELFLLGNEVCGDERVWLLLGDYVRAHAKEFAEIA